jgi:hypothetical protein
MWHNKKACQLVSLCLCCFNPSGWWSKKANHVNKKLALFAGQYKKVKIVNKHPISIEHSFQEDSLFGFK